jgi:hypothetical protein
MDNYKERVEELLRENASIWANLGTKNKLDLGTMQAAKDKWKKILEEIKELDLETWEMLIVKDAEYDDDDEDDESKSWE